MPETDPRKLRSSCLSRLKQGSNGSPLSEAQTACPRIGSVLPGKHRWRTGPEPLNCTAPATPMSSSIRPAPRVPSKQVKTNTLPATNLRASSALICPAKAGAIAAPATTAPNTKRASILSLQLDPSAGDRRKPLYPLLTIPTVAKIGAAWLVKSERVRQFLPQFDREPARRESWNRPP